MEKLLSENFYCLKICGTVTKIVYAKNVNKDLRNKKPRNRKEVEEFPNSSADENTPKNPQGGPFAFLSTVIE